MRDDQEFCPITAATDLLGQKWTLLIVHYLNEAAPHRLRFCELQQRLGGLNPATLSQRLKLLESEGLVERTEVGNLPLHVEYTLTRKGSDLSPVVENLYEWGQRWLTPTKSKVKAKR
jgi:DNA-binding HxlR family transcriptional regulator